MNKILGDDYKKNSGVINSLWFGVPQERRRFIMIGVRSDIIQEKEIEMPEGNGAEIVTVGQAIGDLRDYEVYEAVSYTHLDVYKRQGIYRVVSKQHKCNTVYS